MAAEIIWCVGTALIGAPTAGTLGLIASFQVKPITVDGTVTECYSIGVVFELALAMGALLVAQVMAVCIFIDQSQTSVANTRENYIKQILKILIGLTCAAWFGAEILFVLGLIHLKNGQRCGTSSHLKILRGAGGLCYIQFTSALVYYVVTLVGRRSNR